MSNFSCNKCNKCFTRKSNYEYHINNKKRPCSSENTKNPTQNVQVAPKIVEVAPKISQATPTTVQDIKDIKVIQETLINIQEYLKTTQEPLKEVKVPVESRKEVKVPVQEPNINDVIFEEIDRLGNIDVKNTKNKINCVFCDCPFSKPGNLQRHINNSCKSKKTFDELENLKKRFDMLLTAHEDLKNTITNQPVQATTNNNTNKNTTNNNNSNNTKNQINNGVINNNNNNVTVQLVQFGHENIDNLDTNEVLDVYSKSTGGNILSNVLKYVNHNEKYPENNNICITDLSREYVKIYNGKKFIVKKFKHAKGDIMGKVINNTYKIVNKIESDKKIRLSSNMRSKIRINKVSVQLIDGKPAEEIVREEIREAEGLLTNGNEKVLTLEDDGSDESDESKEERDFTLKEQLRIEHLESKRQGLQTISYERLKEELYNGKSLIGATD